MAHFASAQILTPLFRGVNAQTGTSYTVAFSDEGNLLTFNNTNPVVVSLPQAGTAGFPSGWFIFLENKGSGTLTITPIASTIDGASSLPLGQNQGVLLVSDGTNYATSRGTGSGGGGSGTVTTVGLSMPGELTVSGSPVTTSGTLTATKANQNANTVWAGPTSGGAAAPTFRNLVANDLFSAVNNQTGTTYTVVAGDQGKLITISNAAAIAVTLPQATGSFGSGWFAFFEDRGAGTATITPTISTIDGAASLALTQNQGVCVFSDGTNYFTGCRGTGGGGGGGGATSFQGLSDLKVSLGTYPSINYNSSLAYGFVPSSIAAGTKAVTTDCNYVSGAATVYVWATESGVSCNITGFPASSSGFWAMAQISITQSQSFTGATVTDQRGFRAWGITPGSGFTFAAPSTGNVQINYDSNVLADLTTAQNVMNKSSGQTFTAGTGGTTANLLVKYDGSNPEKVITTATTDTGAGIVVGVALQTVAANASVKVATRGTGTCVADNTVTAGDWIQVGTTTAGDCKDAGATFPTSGGVIGRAQSSAAAGSTFTINLDAAQMNAAGGGGGGGGGTVTSVGLSMPVEFSLGGSPVTTSGTLTATKANESANTVWAGPTSGAAATPAFRNLVANDLFSAVNNQTGTTYTVVAGDQGKLITISNAAAIAVTLPQATGSFGSGWFAFFEDRGAGTATITPTISTIDGATSLALTQNQGVCVFSDGTNYFTGCRGTGGGGGSGSGYSTIQSPPGTNLRQRSTFAARDNLVGADDSTNSRTNIDWTPLDTSVIYLKDEFASGNGSSVTTGNVGELGWEVLGTGPVAPEVGSWPHIGIFSVASTATASTYGDIELANDNGTDAFGAIGSNTNWDTYFIFQLQQTTNTRFYAGFRPNNSAPRAATANGIWLRYDTHTGFADTAFKVEVCSANTCTVGGTTYTVDTGWHKIRIRSTTVGQVIFTFDSNADQTLTTNVPSATLTAFFQCGNDTTASLSNAFIDFFAFKARGVTR